MAAWPLPLTKRLRCSSSPGIVLQPLNYAYFYSEEHSGPLWAVIHSLLVLYHPGLDRERQGGHFEWRKVMEGWGLVSAGGQRDRRWENRWVNRWGSNGDFRLVHFCRRWWGSGRTLPHLLLPVRCISGCPIISQLDLWPVEEQTLFPGLE